MTRGQAGTAILLIAIAQATFDYTGGLEVARWYACYAVFGLWFLKNGSSLALCFLLAGSILAAGTSLVEYAGLLDPTDNSPFAIAYLAASFIALLAKDRDGRASRI